MGGAIATLIGTELVDQVDASRGFRERADRSLFGRAKELGTALFAKPLREFTGQLPRWRRVRLYTFGAPRVGNTASRRDSLSYEL